MTCSGLSSRFGMLGALVGKFPWYSMGTSLIVLVISITGLYFRMSLKVALDDGFVTWNAPSRKEIISQKQFFGAEGDSWYLAIFGLPKNPDGNMLASKEYYELDGFYKNITENLRLSVNTSENEQISYRYMDICEPLCNINDQLQKMMENSWIVDMKYPVSRVLSYDVNIGKHVFKRATINSTGELTGSKLVAFYLTVFVNDDLRKKQVTHFEDEVFRLTAEHNNNPNSLVEIISHGSNSVSREMKRGIIEYIILAVIGHSSAAFLLLVLNGLSGWLNGQSPLGRLTLGLVTLCLMISAMAGSLGSISLMGLPINLLFFTSPFVTLVLVISAYNTFHIMDAWSRLSTEAIRKQFTQSERLAATFEQIAPSYLPTNLSLIIGFFIAHFFLIHNYAVFSLATALALLLNFFNEIFFFSALLCLTCQHSKKAYENHFLNGKAHHKPSISNYPPSMNNNSQNGVNKSNATGKTLTMVQLTKAQKREFRLSFAKRIFAPYVKFLSSGYTKLAMLVILVTVGWFGAGRGLQSLDNRMDYRKMLPNGSPSIRPFDLMDTIWMDILQIVYIVKKPPNFENAAEFAEFRTFVAEASSIPQAMAPRAHMSWIFDYYRDQLNQDFFRLPKQAPAVNMTHFMEFISTFPYKAWQSGVHFMYRPNSKTPTINSMVVLIAYNETNGLKGKKKLMANCRRVAANFPNLDIDVFDTDSQTVDVMEGIPGTCLIFFITLAISVSVVSQILLWDFAVTILTTSVSVSVLGGLLGLGQLLGLELDLLYVPATAVLGALAVFLGQQFIGEFITCWAKEDRMRRALEFTSSPLWKTTIIWLSIAAPQILSSVEFFNVQARLLLLALGLALCHVLILVPIWVDLLPNCLTSKR